MNLGTALGFVSVLDFSGDFVFLEHGRNGQTGIETIFDDLVRYFTWARKKLANEYCNPRLLQISFYTFRHWKATTEYHRTKDTIHVQTMLGHKGLNNTLLYINLEHALFVESDSQEFP